MPNMFKRILFLAILVFGLSFAITVVSPPIGELQNGDTINLGNIGPGQTVSLLIDPKVTSGGIHNEGGLYDFAQVTNLQTGWTSKESKLYANPLQVTISAAPNATEGDYYATVKVIDENNGEQLGTFEFRVKVHITYDVMNFNVDQSEIQVGPGQPARFGITAVNKGSTGDVFEISATGPKRWAFRKQVYVPAMSSKTVNYEIVGGEEETYQATIGVTSLASSIIHDEKNVTLHIRSGLFGDYLATNHGSPLFPIFETGPFALAGLLSNLFGSG